ncbi:MAG: IS110 family transposase [Gammaproteobacteria bacterium]|nr:IS110 family transposase [Gammaproteobacteria bacterium]
MNYCGIDVANETSAVCIIDAQGKVLRRVSIATESGDLASALSGFGRLRVMIEASPLAEWVAAEVEEAGHEPVLVDARAAKHLVSSAKKTDARDAHTLAQMGRSGWYSAVHRKSAAARELRSRLQGRQALLRMAKASSASIRGLLRAQGLRVGRVAEGAFAARVRELVNEAVPALRETIEALLVAWQHSRGAAAQLERALRHESRQDPVRRRLQSVPGVGALVSSVYRATIDDPHRFETPRQVADYVGLAPRVYQSGEIDKRGRISREGDSLLRWHLVEAAHVLLTRGRDCALKRWGLSLAQRKGASKAKVAVARKLAVLLWKLWCRDEAFRAWPESAGAAAG